MIRGNKKKIPSSYASVGFVFFSALPTKRYSHNHPSSSLFTQKKTAVYSSIASNHASRHVHHLQARLTSRNMARHGRCRQGPVLSVIPWLVAEASSSTSPGSKSSQQDVLFANVAMGMPSRYSTH